MLGTGVCRPRVLGTEILQAASVRNRGVLQAASASKGDFAGREC